MAPWVNPSYAADRVALVVGNDAYQHARPLNAAVNDATAVAQALGKLGFDTISVSNGGLEQMVEAMSQLRKRAVGAKAVLLYYAGHGIESDGANYLIPVDAKLEREVQLETQAVNLNSVLERLTTLQVPARMVILDCCRDNPLEGRAWLATRGGGGGLGMLSEDDLGEATLVVYSASPGKPALDRISTTDAHSPFTQALLDQLPIPGAHSFEVFGRIEEEVIRRTEARQKPRLFYNGSTLPFRNFRFAADPAPSPDAPMGGLHPITMPAPVATVQDQPPAATPATPPMPAPPAAAPSAPVDLPARGFFDVDGLFATSSYASHRTYSKQQILKQVQQKLSAQGFYSGTADGSPGPRTQTAIQDWQLARLQEVSGRLTDDMLEALGLINITEAQPPVRPAPSRPTPTPASRPRPSGGPRSAQDILFGN
ncbi:MAG TPA: caspase family protein [Prosthecobacter sp.]|nr:caspase family protein [Prosthecobacter sp.]